MSNGKKEGLATKDELKVLWKVASKELPIPNVLKPITTLIIPSILDGLDNKVGDRIPEPWQTYCEDLITITVVALEDNVITQDEVDTIAKYAAQVVNKEIDLPLIEEDAEAALFLETFRMLATLLYGIFSKKKIN